MTPVSWVTKNRRSLEQRWVRFEVASGIIHEIDEGTFCRLGKDAAVAVFLPICGENRLDGSTRTRITKCDISNKLPYLCVMTL